MDTFQTIIHENRQESMQREEHERRVVNAVSTDPSVVGFEPPTETLSGLHDASDRPAHWSHDGVRLRCAIAFSCRTCDM